MEEYRQLIILICLCLYLGMCIAVGLWAMRRTKSTHDFFVAGRHLGVIVTSVAVFSSVMSGFGFVGGPGLVYRMGMSSIWMVVCTSIGFCMSFALLAKRLRLFAEVCDSMSLPDVVTARYSSRAAGGLTGLAILLGVMGYLGAQIGAMAKVLQQILTDSFADWGWEPGLVFCIVISCGVLVFYCVTGGIIASVYTDVIQGSMMMVAALLVFFAAMNSVEGGFSGMSETLAKDNREAIGPWGTIGIMGALSWYFLFALGGAGQPHVITKQMMVKKISDQRYILPLSIIGYAISALLWISIGLAMRTLVLQGTHTPLDDPDQAAPQFLQNYAHPLLAGLVFGGLFAAIMSTADAFLNIGAAALVHDIPKALFKRPLKNELFWARVGTLGIAAVAAFFALQGQLVALLGAFGWGTFAAAIVPVVAVGLNWKRATATAAVVAIVTSLTINFGIEIADMYYDVKIPYHIDGGAIALVVSLTLFMSISYLSKPPEIRPEIEKVMDM